MLFLLTESAYPECDLNTKPPSPGSTFFQFKVIKATLTSRLERDINKHYPDPEEHQQALSGLSLRVMIKIYVRISMRITVRVSTQE